MPDVNFQLSVLNVVAHPHPEGVYPELLGMVAGRGVRFWGNDHAAISAPMEVEKGLYQGRIAIWTEIDPHEPAINIPKLEEIPFNETGVTLPEDVGFNGRVFLYTLNEATHFVFVEARNEFGKTLSPLRAGRIFNALFKNLPVDAPLVEVTVVPEDDTVDRLLSLHRLDFVHIHLTRPNAEEFGDIVQKYLDELESEGAKSQDVIIRRSPQAETLELNEDHENMAKVSAYHGWMSARGRQEDGDKFDGSTREYPKIIRTIIDGGTSFAAVARRIARNFRPPDGPGPYV